MKMIIDIPDEMLKAIKEGTWCGSHKLEIAIRNGKPYEETEKAFKVLRGDNDDES